jgi:hypothetical protein
MHERTTPGIVHCRLLLLLGSVHLIYFFVPGEVSAPNSATGHTRKRYVVLLKLHVIGKEIFK